MHSCTLLVLVVVALLVNGFFTGFTSLWTFLGLTSTLTDFGSRDESRVRGRAFTGGLRRAEPTQFV